MDYKTQYFQAKSDADRNFIYEQSLIEYYQRQDEERQIHLANIPAIVDADFDEEEDINNNWFNGDEDEEDD